MINGPRAPYRGGMPPQPYWNQMPPQQPMRPMPPMTGRGMRQSFGQPQSRQAGGGILGRLLGRGNGAQRMSSGPLQAGARAAGTSGSTGGILKSLSNPGAITGFLENTQKVLSTAQQFGPIVQQYGPLVKNIPSIWKLYRGLKDSPDESKKEVEQESKESVKNKKSKAPKTIDKIHEEPSVPHKEPKKAGTSKPKLYV